MKIKELIDQIIEFRDKRNWKQFHTIKDLCLGLGIETSELQELFLWKSESEIEQLVFNDKEKIADEIADVFIFLAYIANDLDINIAHAVKDKIKKNDLRYPVEKSFNSNKKYSEL